MLTVVGLMLSGVVAGYFLRNRNMKWVSRMVMALIWVLLFLLGIEVGANDSIINGLHTIGLEALLITVFALAGSLLGAWALWSWINKDKA
jgi:uncharacterized membrane protein YbjE (DUF340 family)